MNRIKKVLEDFKEIVVERRRLIESSRTDLSGDNAVEYHTLLLMEESLDYRIGNKQFPNPSRWDVFEIDKEMVDSLLDIGIPQSESSAYSYIVQRGRPVTAKEVCMFVGRSRTDTYAYLKKLAKRGLVVQEPYAALSSSHGATSTVFQRVGSFYMAPMPQLKISEYVDEKKKVLDEKKSRAVNIMSKYLVDAPQIRK